MHTSKIQILGGLSIFGGHPAEITVHDDLIRLETTEGEALDIDAAQIKRGSFNTMNGMWVLKLSDGRKIRFQGAGGLMSADRTPSGKETNALLLALLKKHRAGRFTI